MKTWILLTAILLALSLAIACSAGDDDDATSTDDDIDDDDTVPGDDDGDDDLDDDLVDDDDDQGDDDTIPPGCDWENYLECEVAVNVLAGGCEMDCPDYQEGRCENYDCAWNCYLSQEIQTLACEKSFDCEGVRGVDRERAIQCFTDAINCLKPMNLCNDEKALECLSDLSDCPEN